MPVSPIRLARIAASLTQEEAAGAIDKSQSWLAKVEAGRIVPSEADLAALGVVCGNVDFSRVCVARDAS